MLPKVPTATDARTFDRFNIDPIVRLPDLLEITGLGRTTIYKLIASGSLQKPLRLSPRSIGWRSSVIQAWLDARASGNDREAA
jgi:prophage regulatory protein